MSGLLTASRQDEWIEPNFPVEPVEPSEVPAALLDALGARARFTGKTATRYFVELESAAAIRRLKPDIVAIARFPPGQVAVTARADDPAYDFISRYFAPGIGVPAAPASSALTSQGQDMAVSD